MLMQSLKIILKIIKELLIKQIYSKVRWRESIIYMMNKGINEFIEIGPGKVFIYVW